MSDPRMAAQIEAKVLLRANAAWSAWRALLLDPHADPADVAAAELERGEADRALHAARRVGLLGDHAAPGRA
jgi:hypothetical protein